MTPVLVTPLGSSDEVRLVGTQRSLIALAYNARSPLQLVNAPTDNTLYVVNAKISDATFSRMQVMPQAARIGQVRLMLQSLLEDRFHLKAHFTTAEMSVYQLVTDKSGSKLPTPDDPNSEGRGGWAMNPRTGEMRITHMRLDELLQNQIFELGDRLIINKSGLDGIYTLTLRWEPVQRQISSSNPSGAPDETAEASLPHGAEASIFTALREQLGLRLVPAKGTVEVLYIDGISPPKAD